MENPNLSRLYTLVVLRALTDPAARGSSRTSPRFAQQKLPGLVQARGERTRTSRKPRRSEQVYWTGLAIVPTRLPTRLEGLCVLFRVMLDALAPVGV